MAKPTPSELSEAVGISQSYASMILSDSTEPAKRRIPPRPLAIAILRKTGWRHDTLASISDEQLAVLEAVEPWPRQDAA